MNCRDILDFHAPLRHKHSKLSDMPSATNDDHDGRYYTETEIGATTTPTGASLVGVAAISGSTYSNLQEFLNLKSCGKISGGTIIDGGSGTVDVATGTGMIKIADSPTAINKFLDWDADTGVVLTDLALNYIYVDYNVGTEAVTIKATTNLDDFDTCTRFPIGIAYRRGNTVEALDDGVDLVDYEARNWKRLENRGLERMSGATVAEKNTRYLTVTSGVYYMNVTEIPTSAIDTSGTDRFVAVYQDGIGGWTYEANQQQFSNILYDDGDGTPGNVGVAKYATYYVYQCVEGDVYVQYGQGDLNTLTVAQTEPIPTPPDYLAKWAELRAKIIILRGAINATLVTNYAKTTVTSYAVDIHNELAGLDAGEVGYYGHTTSAQNTEMIARFSGTRTTIGGYNGSNNHWIGTTGGSEPTNLFMAFVGNVSGGVTGVRIAPQNNLGVYIDADGDVGVGKESSGEKFEVDGNALIEGTAIIFNDVEEGLALDVRNFEESEVTLASINSSGNFVTKGNIGMEGQHYNELRLKNVSGATKNSPRTYYENQDGEIAYSYLHDNQSFVNRVEGTYNVEFALEGSTGSALFVLGDLAGASKLKIIDSDEGEVASINSDGDIDTVGTLNVGGNVTLEALNIITDTTTGLKIGTSTSQKLGIFNATPVNQPNTVSDAATQDLTGSDTVDQTKLEADLTSCKNAINAIIDRLQELGLIA